IPIRLERDGLRIPIELRLPPAFGGFTGKATLRVDRTSGLRIDSLRIRIGPVPLGALVINEIDLSYTGAGEAWTGKGSVTVPAGGKLDASVSFEGGDFAGARMGFTPATPIPLGPFVYLLSVDGGFDVSP